MDWNKVRQRIPALEKYTYLNAAEGAPISVNSAEAGKQFYDEMLRHGDLPYEDWLKRKESTREKVAWLINADPSEIAFTTNTSMAMNIIADMLKDGGDVVTMKDEFPSTSLPWLYRGKKVHFVDTKDHRYSAGSIKEQFEQNDKANILVTSFVQYCTGFKQNLSEVGQLTKKHGKTYIVNATQGIGAFPIDVKKSQIDFLAFSSLKWLMAGYGIGVIYISKEQQERLKFPIIGWQSNIDPDLMDNQLLDIKNNASALEVGTPHFPNIFSLGGSIDFIKEIGLSNIEKRILQLGEYLVNEMKTLGLDIITPLEEEHRSGITIIKLANAPEIANQLIDKGIIVSARGEGLRVSTHFFNTEEDIDVLVKELKALC